MSTDMNNDKNFPPDTEAYYETIASQEEIYLEETEEELRAVLTSEDDPSPPQKNSMRLVPNLIEREPDCEAETTMTDANSNPRLGDSLHERLNQAAEELITGDSDDPPLSEESVMEMLTMTHVLSGSDA